MSILKQNKIFALLIFLLVMLFAILFVYVIQPLRVEKTELGDQLKRKKMEMTAMLKKTGNNEQADDRNLIRLDQVRQRIPEQPYTENLLRDLRLMEVSSGIQMSYYNIQVGDQPLLSGNIPAGSGPSDQSSLQNAQMTETAGQQNISSLGQSIYPVQITTEFSGGYLELYRLLTEAETMNRLWHIQNITFTQVKRLGNVTINKSNSALRCQVTFVSYYAPGLSTYFTESMPIDYEPASNQGIPF